jgi:hypothetical protein
MQQCNFLCNVGMNHIRERSIRKPRQLSVFMYLLYSIGSKIVVTIEFLNNVLIFFLTQNIYSNIQNYKLYLKFI